MKSTKQKTATIVSYRVFGTRNTACYVKYKGKQVKEVFDNNYESTQIKDAIAWCVDNGFTHFKLVYN